MVHRKNNLFFSRRQVRSLPPPPAAPKSNAAALGPAACRGDALRDVASGLACDPAQAALAWTMARPGVTSTIVGARPAVQLASNIAAASIRLNDDQMNRLNEVSKPTDGFTSSLASPMIRKMVFGGHDVTGWGE